MKYELDLYDKWSEGLKEGIEIGEAKGREEGATQIAIAMLKDNVGFETIAQYTQLTIETIKKLAPQMPR